MTDDGLTNELMPNSSEAQGIYDPPVDDSLLAEDELEKSAMASAYPIFEDLLAWFDDAIAGADSVTQARNTAKKNDIDLEYALVAHEIVAALLISKRDELLARFNSYTQKDDDTQ